MKKIFLICLICLIGKIGFAQSYDGTATITIIPPSSIIHEIGFYYLEYCETTEASNPEAEWEYLHVTPEVSFNFFTGSYEYTATTYILMYLNPNTEYIVRVRASYREYGVYGEYIEFGKYGPPSYFMTPEYEGSVSTVVNCGPMLPLSDHYHPIYMPSLSREFPERTLYRSKEEWEQLT